MSHGRRRAPARRWPWQKHPPGPSPEMQEARASRIRAEVDLDRTRKLAAEVTSVAAEMRRLREQNHIKEVFAQALGAHR